MTLLSAGLLGFAKAQTPSAAPAASPYAEATGPSLSVRAEVTSAGGVNLQWLPTDPTALGARLRRGVRLERFRDSGTGADPAPGAAPDYTRRLGLLPAEAWADGDEDDGLYEDLAALADEPPAAGGDPDAADNALASLYLILDVDFGAARRAGLGYADGDVAAGATYTYVVSDGETGEALVSVAVATAAPTDYPAPVIEGASRPRPDHVVVSWDRLLTLDAYDAYVVERARLDTTGDPGPWTARSLPLFYLVSEGLPDSAQVFRDTAAHRDTAYAYRVQGLTPFGHYGAVSDTVVSPAQPAPLVDPPEITLMTRVTDTLFRLAWALPEGSAADDVRAWRVYSSREPRSGLGVYADGLAAGTRELALVDPPDAYYFTVEAIDRNGVRVRSDPKLLRALDRRPPAPPRGLTGAVDSAGVVRLAWAANPEDDVLGYRVFVSNRDTGFFQQVTPRATTATAYVDTVSMALLDREVYYRITAEDFAGNRSGYSAVATVVRPDRYPPTPPVIADVRGSVAAVEIEVARSPSRDVVAEVVQRRLSGAADTTWGFLADVPAAATPAASARRVRVADTTAVPGLTYDYRVVAADGAGQRAASVTVAAGRTPTMEAPPLRDFAAEVLPGTRHPTLRWRGGRGGGEAGALEGFQVQRAELPPDADAAAAEPVPYRLLSERTRELRLRAGTFYFVDREARPGRRYVYNVYALHLGGASSPLTPSRAVAVPE